MNKKMETVADIRKWLLQFRTMIYTKDKKVDLELMEGELKEFHEAGLLDSESYQRALLVLRREKRLLTEE